MADIVVTPVDVVVTPDVMVTVKPKGAVVVPNGWSVLPSGGAMPQYDGVNAAVEARILQAESGMQSSLDAKTAQLLSDIQDVETGLSTETATRVSEDNALATRIDTEVARIDDNVAAVQSGVVTNANNHSALATQFDTYVAKTDSAIASANNEITVVAGKADANASAIGEMQVVMDGREASYAEAIDLTVTKLYEHFYYPVVPADLPTDYVAGDYLKFGYDYDASHPAGTVIHALSDCAGTFDLADWETPADQTVPRQYTASSTKIETLEADTTTLSARISTEEQARADGDSALSSRVTTLEADTEDIDVRLTTTEEVTAGYFHVWDGTETLQIGMKSIDADGTTWTYLGGSLGENSDGWVKDNPQDDIAVTRKLNDVNTNIFFDSFDYVNDAEFKKMYTERNAGEGEISFVTSDSTITGGKVMQVGNDADDDMMWRIWNHPVDFDPDTLYKISVRMRRVSGTGTAYIGVAGFADDKETLVNKDGVDAIGGQYYAAGFGIDPSDNGWHVYTGYIKGNAATGYDHAKTDPDDPSYVHENVRYISPIVITNYYRLPGVWEVDYFVIEDYTDTKALDDAYKEYNRVVALAIADGTLTAEEQALIAHAQAAVDEAKAKLNDALAIIQSPDNLLKWGNPTDAGTGWTQNRKSSSSVFPPYVRAQQERDQYETEGIDGTGNYHVIPLSPGEKIYISGWVNTEGTTFNANIGGRMTIDRTPQNAWPTKLAVGPGQGWTYFECEIQQYDSYNGFIPFTQIPTYDTFGTVLWANLVYSRTPHRKRVDQVAGWAAGASSLITDPDGNITGWSYGDGSNVQSQFKIMADVLSIVDTDDNTRALYDGGVWRSYDAAGNYSELSAGNLKFYKAGDQYPYHYVKHIKALTASSGSTVSISGFYAFPNIIVSPKSMPTYDQANSNADQSLEVGFSNLSGDSESGNWTFDVTASLNLNDAILNYTKTYNVYDIDGAVFNQQTFQWEQDPWYSPVLSIGSGIVSYDFSFYYNLWCDDVNKTMYIEVQHSSDGSNWTTVGSYSWGGQIQHADRILSGSVSVSSASTWQLRVYIHASGNLGEDYNIDAFRLEVTTHGEGASQLVQGTVNCLIVG